MTVPNTGADKSPRRDHRVAFTPDYAGQQFVESTPGFYAACLLDPEKSNALINTRIEMDQDVTAEVFIDHLTLPVRDLEASRSFYRRALAPFGVEEIEAWGGVGWGPPGRIDFFIRQGESTAPLHLAFAAPDRPTVDAFHTAALAAGGTNNGAPGLRPHYHETYYSSYVIDLDGHNVEAVCHAPEQR